MTGIPEGQECLVRIGQRWHEATVRKSLPKRYELDVKGFADPVTTGAAKVMPARQKPALLLPNDKAGMKMAIEAVKRGDLPTARRELAPQPKPDKPEQSPAYMKLVHTLPCCNCHTGNRIEAHHEGKKGVSQKVRDTLTVPLCNYCHDVYTRKNCLPDPIAMARPQFDPGHPDLLSRENSLAILRDQQEQILDHVLTNLPQAQRIEVKSKAVAYIKPAALSCAWGNS